MGICYDCKSIAVILNTQYLKMMIRKQPWILLKMQSHIKSFHYKWKLLFISNGNFCPFALATI